MLVSPAGLVHAKHVHFRGVFRGTPAGDQHPTPGQFLRPKGHADREHAEKGDRNRAHQEGEQQRNHFHERRAADQGEHENRAKQ